jgi:hypothetical protein
LPQKRWVKPEADWVPLKQAVFRYAIADPADSDLSDEQVIDLTEAKIVTLNPMFLSLAQLTKMLKDKSGAIHAEIDRSTSTFSFLFPEDRRPLPKGRRPRIGTPWELLKRNAITVADSEQQDMVHKALDFVWCKLMLPAFNSAISRGAVALYARPHITSEHFQRLPAHVWPLLNVVDWDNGIAMAVDHTVFWSICAQHVTTNALAEAELVDARFGEAVASSDLKEAPRTAINDPRFEKSASTSVPTVSPANNATSITNRELRRAADSMIHNAISKIYDEAKRTGRKPPNVKEIVAPVQDSLRDKGSEASGRRIQHLAEADQHKSRRRKPGATVLNENRRQPK